MQTDMDSVIAPSRATSPGAITAGNATLTTQTIDRKGYESLEFIYISGTVTDGVFTVTMYEGDASNMSDETAVAAADILGTSPVFTGTTSADDDAVKRFGYKGSKRYVRCKAVQSGATTGGYLAAVAILGKPRYLPTA